MRAAISAGSIGVADGATTTFTIYPSFARATVRAGADALFNLSNDAWYANTAGVSQHYQKAGVLRTDLPRAWRPSFYRRFGDVFALACCAASAGALLLAIARATTSAGRGAGPDRAPR